MKVIDLTFDPSVLGVATLTNTQTIGNNVISKTLTSIPLNAHNVGAYVTVQTIFTGVSPTYNIEVNLGYMPISQSYSGEQGEMVVDPDGWQLMPASILSPDSSIGLPIYFSAPFFAIRVNIATAGDGTGRIKVLQQGVV